MNQFSRRLLLTIQRLGCAKRQWIGFVAMIFTILVLFVLLRRDDMGASTINLEYPNYGNGYGLHKTRAMAQRDAMELSLGNGFREIHKTKKATRLREMRVKSLTEVDLWSFRHSTYLWDYYTPYWPCVSRERIGRLGDGGKWVCNMDRIAAMPPGECIVYSFGVRDEVSFELELASRTKCKIYAHDPSVPSLPDAARGTNAIKFRQVGLDDKDNAGYETLETAMRHNGHSYATLLKVDIEHTEKRALPALLRRLNALKGGKGGVPFHQLLLEVHHSDKDPNATIRLLEALEEADIVPFSNEHNMVPCLMKERPKVLEYSYLSLRFAPLT